MNELISQLMNQRINLSTQNTVCPPMSQKMHKLWNGIAGNSKYRLWWSLA